MKIFGGGEMNMIITYLNVLKTVIHEKLFRNSILIL